MMIDSSGPPGILGSGDPTKNGWALWYVTKELERLAKENNDLRREIQALREDTAVLKVKSGLWGSGAGIIAASLMQFALSFVRKD